MASPSMALEERSGALAAARRTWNDLSDGPA